MCLKLVKQPQTVIFLLLEVTDVFLNIVNLFVLIEGYPLKNFGIVMVFLVCQ